MRTLRIALAAGFFVWNAPSLAQTTLSPDSADWLVLGEQPTATFGARLSTAGDVDGDGAKEIALFLHRQHVESRAAVRVFRLSPTGAFDDCNADGVPDECQTDCNDSLLPDDCDVALGVSLDCDSNGVPDACDPDCDGDLIPDRCELDSGAADCNENGLPDSCETNDLDGNGVPDDCDLAARPEADCNRNGVPDLAELEPRLRFPSHKPAVGGDPSGRRKDPAVCGPMGSNAPWP